MAQPKLKMRLGDLLIQEKILTEDQIQLALQQQKSTGRKLGGTLIDLGFISEEQLLKFLAQQLNVPFFDLNTLSIDPHAVHLLPEVHARRYRALVVNVTDNIATVVMSDPADLSAMDAIAALLGKHEMSLAVAKEGQLLDYFDRLYRRTKEIESFAEQLRDEYQESDFELGSAALDVGANENEATVAKLLRSLFEDAVQMNASDIHIEPDEKVLRIRQRIDGVLHENTLSEVRIAQALVLRLKLVAGLDISEKRLPQDGRFNIKVRGHDIDVRMSTMPVQYGESVVMRLLDQSSGILSLEDSGMPADILKRLRWQLHRPHGMILVTGPTGSGKTTTLYGALSELNESSVKIITVEDPVEYRLSRINQVQVNPKIGLTFANVLRTTLRQDPDILLVGEMRDSETVEIGLRGALTGHLVLSTLHTNDSITSALRLIDMGAPGYLVASALRAVIAQRLVRKICTSCSHEVQPDESEQAWLASLADSSTRLDSGNDMVDTIHALQLIEDEPNHRYFKGRGCQSCNFTGYAGRLGVHEFLELDQAMMDALRRNDPEGFTRAARSSSGFRPLAMVALDYARQGITSLEEVLKLVEDME